MKNILFSTAIIAFLLPVLVNAATINAASCSYNDVSAAINSAQSGDTVLVPAGSCTWNDNLVITKGIYLIGAGIGNTVITSNYYKVAVGNVDERNYLIVYKPSSPGLNEPFRISGFEINGASKCLCLYLYNPSATVPIKQVRVDHNKLYGATDAEFGIEGPVYGVFDNNVVIGTTTTFQFFGPDASWLNWVYNFGTGDTFFMEDNTITIAGAGSSSAAGTRWCWRHNAFTLTSSCFPIHDAHGNGPDATRRSTMGVEIYENTYNGGGYGANFFGQRGGKALVYNNIFTNFAMDVWMYPREEYYDSTSPPATNPGGQPQHVSDSYYWNNLKSGTLFHAEAGDQLYYSDLGRNVPLENYDFWNQAVPFVGTGGMGVGLLSARPTTCSVGVGYWASDQNRFYKCTATNTWTLYYIPYTYPHPFRTNCVNYPGLCDSGSPPPPACTENDWIHTDGICRSNNTLIRTWTKIGTCTGGVSHPATESIACTYTPPNCTEADWTHTDGTCRSNNTLIRTWTKIGTCTGGVSHPVSESVSCTYVPTTYYVSTTGNDSNPGTLAQPWRNIQKAANTLVAGDSVIVTAGDYSSERTNLTRSGSPGLPITYQAQGTVVMKGFKIIANYITVKGFEIANTDYVRWQEDISAGVYVQGNHVIVEDNYVHDSAFNGITLVAPPSNPTLSSNCTVRNNRLYRNEMAGIEMAGRNNLVEGNEIWGTVQCHPALVAGEGGICLTGIGLDADGMRFFGYNHIIRGNYIHDIDVHDPANRDPHIDCFQTWESSSYEGGHNITFEKNRCINNNNGMFVAMIEGATYLTFKNNLFMFGTGGGLNINPSNGPNNHITIVNNLFIGNTSAILQSGCQIEVNCWPAAVVLNEAPYCAVKNNIFYDMLDHSVYIAGNSNTGLQAGKNIMYRSDGQPLISAELYNHANDFWGVDPKLVNPAASDYHLQASSPAIDTGYDLTGLVSDDYDNNSRPQGAGYDIGAFEYVGGGCVLPSDVNCDGIVNLIDLRLVANDFGKTSGLNNAKSDTNTNGIVDIFDVVYVASRFI